MKKLITSAILLISIQVAYSQSIVDFFYSIPEKYVDNLSFIERRNLIQNQTLEKDDMLYSLDYDSENGYLRLEQSYTEGQSGYGIYEITYWNLKSKKLIAVSSVMGSNGGFHQNDFKFFEYENGNLSEVRNGYLKSYTSNFKVFINNLISEFTKKGTNQSDKDNLRLQFTIDLPRKGKNISASFKEGFMGSSHFDNYSKFLKLREKTFVFNLENETFE
ncbi:hypothetical protein J2X31_003580 [Flavobacterium arsenatis]|uniref:Uncharacterized protein n=1 Tax=Flavobacterium arsenatis TaxID=1484332 RepID=A0ABU1TUJ3_9FLAO|nr:hypothetical protein [Flavobacterium arsenatis]MDR6969547.1 hypothetical protein [Flavobacterium arsenatis]